MTHLLLTNFVCVKVGQDFMKGDALFVSCCSSRLGEERSVWRRSCIYKRLKHTFVNATAWRRDIGCLRERIIDMLSGGRL